MHKTERLPLVSDTFCSWGEILSTSQSVVEISHTLTRPNPTGMWQYMRTTTGNGRTLKVFGPLPAKKSHIVALRQSVHRAKQRAKAWAEAQAHHHSTEAAAGDQI